jgi:hypothetical protein
MERGQQAWASGKGQTKAVRSQNCAGDEEEAEAYDKILPDL